MDNFPVPTSYDEQISDIGGRTMLLEMNPASLQTTKSSNRVVPLEQRIEQVVKENGERRVEIVYLRKCLKAGERLQQKILVAIVRMKLDSALLEYDPAFQDNIVVDAVGLLEHCLYEYDLEMKTSFDQFERFWTDALQCKAHGQTWI